MPLASPETRADWRQPSRRQRALVIALTLVAEILFLLMLLGLGPASWSGREGSKPTLVELIPDQPAPAAPAPSPSPSAEAKAKPPPPIPTAATPRLPPTPLAKSPFLELTREEFAAADIGKLGTASGASTGGETSASVGTGPGGATLYKAEWFREPTEAELAGYLPKRNIEPGAWAEVACKTIPDNRVENCQALGESPPGSGLARALRLAGWQFRIRPPRIDGKPMVGTWVKVHLEFSQ